jgi:plasmid stability protein
MRAGEHGVSVEEEHRWILREALHADAAEKRKSFWLVLSAWQVVDDDLLFEQEHGFSGRAKKQNVIHRNS